MWHVNLNHQVQPHVVYLTDDAALQLVGVPLLKYPPLEGTRPQIVFSGVNADVLSVYPDVFPADSIGSLFRAPVRTADAPQCVA